MRDAIAIVGMGAILPDAMNLSEYWSNILAAKDSIKDISEDYWDVEDFYDPDPTIRDKSYSYKAGEVSAVEFDSMGFGVAPKVMESISVEQLYALVVARQALLDADMIGKNAKAFNHEKTGVIMAASVGKSAFALTRRQDIPLIKKILKNSGVPDELIAQIVERLLDSTIEWTENSEPGFLANVVAGRIANRFDLNGTNCAVDAACASSLAALKVAINELQCGDCDVVLAGGVNLDLTSTAFISFCKTPAISKSNISRPFDADADGMILGDGVAMVVLKRLDDAKRDGDRIYAVIKAIASSGDGRATSIFAPNKEGQLKALSRAYEKTDINPDAVTLVEAHGTGTHVGDGCEVAALTQFFEGFDVEQNTVAIGSIKSQIGHSRLTAGMSSLIKTALALHHRTLPPTINVNKDRPDLLESPFYTLETPQPWITDKKHPIRRAGVSSFGFGGTNFHVVLEEYIDDVVREKSGNLSTRDYQSWRRVHRIPTGITLDAPTVDELVELCKSLIERIIAEPVAYDELLDSQRRAEAIAKKRPRVGFVSKNAEDAIDKLYKIVDMLREDNLSKEVNLEDEGIYFREKGLPANVKVATLFSGQGSQYLGMFNELARDYPEMSDFLSLAGEELESRNLRTIADILYGAGKKISQTDAEKALKDTKYTQPALAAVCGGLYRIVQNRGYTEDFVIGHSFGELTGLWASSAIDSKTFMKLAASRGEFMSASSSNTGMMSITADVKSCENLIKEYDNLYIANENCDTQTVISGNMAQITELATKLKDLEILHTILNVSQAFHSPYMQEANRLFGEELSSVKFSALEKNLYNGADSKLYEQKSTLVKKAFSKQIESPVRFAKCIEHAYENGAKVFVEFGPGKTLTNLTRRILGDKECYILALDGSAGRKNAHEQFEGMLIYLRVLGMKLSNDIYRKSVSELFKSDKPKSSYLIHPMGYVTPEKKQIIEDAVERVNIEHDLVPAAQSTNLMKSVAGSHEAYIGQTALSSDYVLDDIYNEGGEPIVSKSTLESTLALQTVGARALEEFLASQGNQMEVFKELFKEAADGAATNNVLRFAEIFQNNSLRAFEVYMGNQQNVLNEMEPILESDTFAQRPQLSAIISSEVSRGSSIHEQKPTQQTQVVTEDLPVRENKAIPIISAKEASEAPEVVTKELEVSVLDDISDTDDFDPVQIMIKVISEKSGYPEELIDAEMNIEADLGIDSIKRIEIFAEISKQIPGELNQDDVEAISMLHTIQEIGDYIKKKKITSYRAETQSTKVDTDRLIKRYEVTLDDALPIDNPKKPAKSGLVIINADNDGVASYVAKQLLSMGYEIAIITMPQIALSKAKDYLVYSLVSDGEDAIADTFEKITSESNQPLAGFIHIGSKEKKNSDEAGLFPKSETNILKTVFLCAKYFVQANRHESSFFVSAVRIDGGLGLSSGNNIVQGGLFGLHKSLAIEWEEQMLSKAVDLASEFTSEMTAKHLIEEIFDTGYAHIEVGRNAEGRRLAPKLFENYVERVNDRNLALEPSDTLLVTGGGRGVTAACVVHLAKIARCGFVLLGRTDLSVDVSWAKGERDKMTLKRLALARFTEANPGVKPKPAEIDKLVSIALNHIEIMDTLEAIKVAGGRAVYISCDVRDVKQLKAVVKEHEREFGTITGLIHGAGTIADKKIQRKTEADFDYVFGSKIEGLDACMHSLELSRLKYLILFSSVAGFFGNGGQTDYSIANEVLSKFALYLRSKQPSCKAVSINWGAWDGGSMVDESIRNITKDTELSLIPIDVGTTYFTEQFYEHDNPAQIVINCTDRLIRPKIDNLVDLR